MTLYFAALGGFWQSACFRRLSLPEMLSGANTFEISDFQEDEIESRLTRRSECNNVTLG